MKPKISIIIPVYNGSNYLKKSIDSALGQVEKNVEVIVVNDGSNDGGKTEKIAKSYGKKIRYFKKKNGGVSTALNLGIKEMKGEWFAWLSHDDYFFPGKSKIEEQFIKKYPSTKVFLCNTGVIDKDDKVLHNNNPEHKSEMHGAAWYFKAWAYGCSLLIHKSCFKQVGDFNIDNRTTQDVLMAMDLLSEFKVRHISRILVNRRDHSEQGVVLMREENQAESEDLKQHLINSKSIKYFYPEVDIENNKDTSHFYNKLGMSILPYSQKSASMCFHKSMSIRRSIFNHGHVINMLTSPPLRRAYLNLLGRIHKNKDNLIQPSIKIFILDMPSKFQPKSTKNVYPKGNEDYGLEQDFLKYLNKNKYLITKNPDLADWHYLPVFWMRWHLNHDYGKKGKIELNQGVQKAIVFPEKTFTICMYGGGPLVDTGDIRVYETSRSDKEGFDIPLLSLPLPRSTPRVEKIYKASFVGRISTHETRRKMKKVFSSEKEFLIKDTVNLSRNEYAKIIQKSLSVLAPRGVGGSSFRFFEAMQLGAVPVLIGNIDNRPFKKYIDWDSLSIYAKTPEEAFRKVNSKSKKDLIKMGIEAEKTWENSIKYQKWCELLMKDLGSNE